MRAAGQAPGVPRCAASCLLFACPARRLLSASLTCSFACRHRAPPPPPPPRDDVVTVDTIQSLPEYEHAVQARIHSVPALRCGATAGKGDGGREQRGRQAAWQAGWQAGGHVWRASIAQHVATAVGCPARRIGCAAS